MDYETWKNLAKTKRAMKIIMQDFYNSFQLKLDL
jgi:hypothetical protein